METKAHEMPSVDNIKRWRRGARRSEIIPGAGHRIQQEAPDRVNALLVEFLRGL